MFLPILLSQLVLIWEKEWWYWYPGFLWPCENPVKTWYCDILLGLMTVKLGLLLFLAILLAGQRNDSVKDLYLYEGLIINWLYICSRCFIGVTVVGFYILKTSKCGIYLINHSFELFINAQQEGFYRMLLKNIDTKDKLFNIIVTEQIVFEQSAVPVTTMCSKNLLQRVFF